MRAITLTLHPAIDRVVQVKDLVPGATFDCHLLLNVPSGKGVNTARGLSNLWRWRERILAAVWLGRGESAWFQTRLREISGIRAAVCPRDCATRFAHTIFERSGRETHMKEAMLPVRPAEARALLAFWRKTAQAGDVVALCGSAPAQTSPQTLREIFRVSRARKVAAFLADTNGPALEVAGAAGLDGIKGNAAEIGVWLRLPKAVDIRDAAHRRALRAALDRPNAPRAILMTMGAAGALLATPRELLHATPPPLSKKTGLLGATGCGDAATAGWMWAILDGCSASETLRRCVACGTAKLHSPDPGLLDAKLVPALLKRTRVRTLALDS